MRHQDFMRLALQQAQIAMQHGEVPVGAVLVAHEKVLALASNVRESAKDPVGHAEVVALREGARRLDRWRLTGCTLYVTLEPCPMCTAAAILARIERLVFGASDPKLGACGTVWHLPGSAAWNHRLEIVGGILEQESGELLHDFFAKCRIARLP
ncbi:MAG: nucleoside deaminase [Cyanobacteria bacterium NC_groundwater_1444_Ag_S-0.65um_54_12]|nr:nucleoside deaminase [Cyanobacteria bacterium NC_groundwater_1444_Ag_S-0.65um_54_12]